jgi:hypothetical protein
MGAQNLNRRRYKAICGMAARTGEEKIISQELSGIGLGNEHRFGME